jgi:hypothetical protein
MPTLVNSIKSKYSTSIMFLLLASIFVKKLSQKFLNLRENFRILAKIYPPIKRFYGKKLNHMYHTCRITVKFNGFFGFPKIFTKFLWDFRENFAKFRENRPIFAWLSHFRENWKMHCRFNPSLKSKPSSVNSSWLNLYSKQKLDL